MFYYKMKQYDIAIAFRCYPWISKTPKYRSTDKLAMITWWLKSMVKCLWDLNTKFFIIADGISDSWKEEIIQSLWECDYEYIYTDHIWNNWTYGKQIDILLNQSDSEIVYFAEDDYLYNIYDNQWFEEWIKLLREKKADFISLFDHRGIYNRNMHKYKKNYIITENKIWKTEVSTCCTFMTTKKTLWKTKNILLKYTKWCWDYPMWIILTKINAFRIFDIDYSDKIWLPQNKKPRIIQKLVRNFPGEFVSLVMAYVYWRKDILFWKKYKLYIPTPSTCTHLEKEDIAPLINWDKVVKDL